MKPVLLILFICLRFSGHSQIKINSAESKFDFTKLTFHSSACYGFCPEISLNLYKDKRIELSRLVYKSRGKTDSVLSGNFKGSLNDKDFEKITGLLKKTDWEKVDFSKILCCDAPIVTIILSYNDQHKQFKSMEPPKETTDLIDFLITLSSSILLPRYDKAIDFEVVADPANEY